MNNIWSQVEKSFNDKRYSDAQNYFKKIEEIKVLDPACGSGSFLIKAYNLFIEFYEKYNLRVDETNNKISSEFSKLRTQNKNEEIWKKLSTMPQKIDGYRKKILKNNIYGVDLDPQAAEIASVNLMLQALKRGERLPLVLNDNIKVGNSLISGISSKKELDNYRDILEKIKELRVQIKEISDQTFSDEKIIDFKKRQNELVFSETNIRETLNMNLNKALEHYFGDEVLGKKPFN